MSEHERIVSSARGVAAVGYKSSVPALFRGDEACARRTFEFFTVNIRNQNTRKAYARAATDFAAWCEKRAVRDIGQVEPVHVAAYIEGLGLAAPSVKQRLAALRMLFDWLVVGQVLSMNPAGSVRGPRFSVSKGRTQVLNAEEARALLDSIDTNDIIGLRDRALIGLMIYTFARVGAAIGMTVGDVYVQGRRTWIRLHEKGGKVHEVPCHSQLEAWLHAYMDGASISDCRGVLFQSVTGRSGGLSGKAMAQADVFRMIGRRAMAAGIRTRVGCHSFRATGITEYLRSGGLLEVAQAMAGHESARTTGLYDRRSGQVTHREVERISI
jgi:site-specific recombinase XerD